MQKSERYLVAIALSCFFLTLACAFVSNDKGESWRLIGLRQVAHGLLLQSGDTESRILPIAKISNTEYEIRFEKGFRYETDSLIALVQKQIEQGHLPSDYVVSVIEAESNEQYFTFGQSSDQKLSTACLGRNQPFKHYKLRFTFSDADDSIPTLMYAGVVPIVLLLIGFRRKSPEIKSDPTDSADRRISIGQYRYDSETKILSIAQNHDQLTEKEAKVLEIFARHQNQVVARITPKEVWEDEGVIVGRSLDVFISKLRKKLESDPEIKITSIHGKGYKLVVSGSFTRI